MQKHIKSPLNVVITGGTKGFGRALVKQFHKRGDNVILTSRSRTNINEVIKELSSSYESRRNVIGIQCDMSSPENNAYLLDEIGHNFENVDIWINNAGQSGGFGCLKSQASGKISDVVDTNLKGTVLGTKSAIEFLTNNPSQTTMGHIFNVIGAGSDGFPTPNYAVYGATKSGINQFTYSIQRELQGCSTTSVHLLSPGMMITDLLIEGTTDNEKRIFNMMCEMPETVAEEMVPKLVDIVNKGRRNQKVCFLTLPRIIRKLTFSFIFPSDRFFKLH